MGRAGKIGLWSQGLGEKKTDTVKAVSGGKQEAHPEDGTNELEAFIGILGGRRRRVQVQERD
jgi:hypothetical protein